MEIDYEKLAIDIGYSYLNGGIGYWEDGAGKLHSYDSMDNDYLKNCLNFVDRGIKEITNDEVGISKDIKKHLSKIIENVSEKDIEYAKTQISEILTDKKKELKECLKRRKTFL